MLRALLNYRGRIPYIVWSGVDLYRCGIKEPGFFRCLRATSIAARLKAKRNSKTVTTSQIFQDPGTCVLTKYSGLEDSRVSLEDMTPDSRSTLGITSTADNAIKH